MKIVFTKFKVKVTVLTNFHFKYPVSEVDNDDNVRSSAGWQRDPNKSLNESKQRLIWRLPLIKDNKHWEEKTAGGDLYLNRSPRNLSKHRTTICVRESGQSANKKIPVLVNFELLFHKIPSNKRNFPFALVDTHILFWLVPLLSFVIVRWSLSQL